MFDAQFEAWTDALALGQLSLASSTLISIACFVLGSACCALCVQWARRRVRHEYALALLIQAVLMLLFGLLAGRGGARRIANLAHDGLVAVPDDGLAKRHDTKQVQIF